MEKFPDFMPSMDQVRKQPQYPSVSNMPHCPQMLPRSREISLNVQVHHEGGSVPLQHLPARPSDMGKHFRKFIPFLFQGLNKLICLR